MMTRWRWLDEASPCTFCVTNNLLPVVSDWKRGDRGLLFCTPKGITPGNEQVCTYSHLTQYMVSILACLVVYVCDSEIVISQISPVVSVASAQRNHSETAAYNGSGSNRRALEDLSNTSLECWRRLGKISHRVCLPATEPQPLLLHGSPGASLVISEPRWMHLL